MADLAGRQLGDFQLLRRLGQGGMAEVYLAEQVSLRRQVAVKILRPELASDETYLRRFEREAQAAAALVHANIVQVYEVGRRDGLHYIAQEYVQGQNLREWLARHGSPDLPRALSVMLQVSSALVKAGQQGIVHRDIKPENILIAPGGEVKVADFGLARVPRDDGVELTQVGVTMGTPLYMSPEQIEGRPLDPRSDLYSFGVTCYHMLAGKPPFTGETALAIAVQHVKKQPEPLSSQRSDLPESLCRVVHRLLQKLPEERYATARELFADLRAVHAEALGETWSMDLPLWQPVDSGPTPHFQNAFTQRLDRLMKGEPAPGGRRMRPGAWGAAWVLCFVLGGAAAWFAVRPEWLLQGARVAAPAIPDQGSALAQAFYASQVNTPEAWQSVLDHYGENEYLRRRAQQHLSRFYLLDRDYARAMKIYGEFVRLDPKTDPDLVAFGLAGQCCVFTLQGRYEESARVLEQLWPYRNHLDERLRREMRHAVERTRRERDVTSTQQMESWLSEQLGAED